MWVLLVETGLNRECLMSFYVNRLNRECLMSFYVNRLNRECLMSFYVNRLNRECLMSFYVNRFLHVCCVYTALQWCKKILNLHKNTKSLHLLVELLTDMYTGVVHVPPLLSGLWYQEITCIKQTYVHHIQWPKFFFGSVKNQSLVQMA